MSDIRSFFGGKQKSTSSQGGGDVDKDAVRCQKRKLSQQNYDKSKRSRLFKESWLKEYEWAEYDTDENALFCKVCRKFPDYADKTSALFCGIRENFRKETLKFHEKSLKHHNCLARESTLKNPKQSHMAQSVKKMHEKNSDVYQKLFSTAYYIAREGEPMTKFSKLCELQEKNGVDLGFNYRNNRGCSDFIDAISSTLKSEIVEDFEKTRFFSILADGSTDRAVSEQEVIYVRFVGHDGKVKTKLADIVDLDHGDAGGVKQGVLKGLESLGVSKQIFADKIVGINTDGASVNMGKKSGAIKRLIDEVKVIKGDQCESYITVVHCIAHNIELAVCDAKKNCAYLNKFEDVLKGIFHFYFYSPKKRRELFEIASNLNKELKHFGGVHTIRWVASQHRALRALLDNYETTIIHLEHIANKSDENAAKAKAYLKELKTNKFLTFLHFMIDWTDQLKHVSEIFQEEFCLVAEVSQRINELKQKFEHMKVRRGKMLRKYEQETVNGEFKGVPITFHAAERRDNPLQQTAPAIASDLDELLNDTVFFLEERFIKHLGGEPHSFFNVFNFKLWPDRQAAGEEFRSYGEEQIESLLGLFEPLLTDEERDNASDQWLDLKLIISRDTAKPVREAYEQILSSTHPDRERVKHILPLVQIMMTISPSTAECERGFSAMNRLMTQSRTSMKQCTLQNLMRINVNGPPLAQFNSRDSVISWFESARGSRHSLGHACPGPRDKVRHAPTSDSESE